MQLCFPWKAGQPMRLVSAVALAWLVGVVHADPSRAAESGCRKHNDVVLLQREPVDHPDSCPSGGAIAIRRHGLQQPGRASLLQNWYTPMVGVPEAEISPMAAASVIPTCNCPPPLGPLPTAAPPEGPAIIAEGCRGEVEILTVDVGLANRARCDNVTLRNELAMAVGVPPERLKLLPWSWTPEHQVGLNFLQEHMAQQRRKICPCEFVGTQGTAGLSLLQGKEDPADPAGPAPAPAPAPGPTSQCVRQHLNRTKLGDAPSKVQMLTRDPCLVKSVRNDPNLIQQAIADLMGIPARQIVIDIPKIAGDANVPPPVNHLPEVILNGSVQVPVTPPGLNYQDPALLNMGPLGVPLPPVPPPAPGAPGPMNRAWIAVWSVEFLPPHAEELAQKFLLMVDTSHSGYAQLLPTTYARVPEMPYPWFATNKMHEYRIPPPRDVAESFGLPLGDIGPEPPDAVTIAAADRNWMRAMMINDEGTRLNHAVNHMQQAITYAEKAAFDALDFPNGPVRPGREAPEIVPPMIATDPTMESPYGPWPAAPPFASNMRPAGVPDPALLSTKTSIRKGLRGRGQLKS